MTDTVTTPPKQADPLRQSELYYTTNDDGVHVRCMERGCGWAYCEGFGASVQDAVDSITIH